MKATQHSLDAGRVKLRRPHSSARVREAFAIAIRPVLRDGAPRAVCAVCAARGPALCNARRLCAASLGVQRHLVVVHEVDALDDVDLAANGPVLALGPKRRPYLSCCTQSEA